MSRYRRVDVRIWLDKKVRGLTPIPACGQGLWFYLLTNPNTNSIPGLYRAGESAMAEELGWSLKGFREAFGEVLAKGMAKVDWEHRVVWIPNAIAYNRPENPNVVIGWAQHLDEIPECNLKEEARQSLKAFVEGFGEAFAKAATKGLPEPCRQPLANQDQDQDSDPSSVPVAPHALPDSGSDAGAHVAPAMPVQSPVPQSLGTAAFLAAWQEFREWRTRQKHKRMTAKAEQLTLAQLEPYGAAVAVEALQASMRNDWQGVFPEKASNGGNGHRRPGPIIAQRDDSGAANTVTITRGRRGV